MNRSVASSALAGQIVRFGISGALVTALQAALYWTLATFAGVETLLANLIAYFAAVATGYVLHSRWSFKDHGTRDNPARTTLRFFLVSLVSLALNSFFVLVTTHWLHGQTWWPIPFMVLVTPAVTFTLNRHWVFG